MKARHRRSSFGKWLVAIAAFVTVLTFAMGDVYGITTPGKPNTGGNEHRQPNPVEQDRSSDESHQNRPDPVATPEPATLLLMGLGLGAVAYKMKSRKS